MTRRAVSLLSCLLLLATVRPAAAEPPDQAVAAVDASPAASVDRIFSRWTAATPGCAVGVSVGGKTLLERGYGMAELEHAIPNRGDTIFEAGSVSKQFTAAAVLLLAREGRLSLDDEVRKYVPELPDFGTPVTIRHLLNHTSGLRDWGSLAGVAGWPRGRRAHTHAHVLDILSRQKALNFTPGSRYSYSNSGYNLAAVIVSRVSGMPFAEFTKRRIFDPLGMAHTSWRDDFTRVVKNRAPAYDRDSTGAYRLDMPFENVHGNGGLLTTVGDLLAWNENFETPRVGDRTFIEELQRTVPFSTGTMQVYALGLRLGAYKGVREVSHSGSTGGYRAFLSRFPGQHTSVAVLCNAGDADAGAALHAVADVYLGAALNASAPREAEIVEMRGPLSAFKRDESYRPAAAELAAFAGTYSSDEVETVLRVDVRDGRLVAIRRPGDVIELTPHSQDRFSARELGIITFRRGAAGIEALTVTQDRVWSLEFRRMGG